MEEVAGTVGPAQNGYTSEMRQLVLDQYRRDQDVACLVEQVSVGLLAAEETIVEWYLQPQGCCVLDIGCGAGREALALFERGYRVVAFDLVGELVEAANRQRPQHGGFSLSQADAVHIPLASNSIDHALMLQQMIHVIPGRIWRRQALAEVYRVLRPGGTFTISFYNRVILAFPLHRLWQVVVRMCLGGDAWAVPCLVTPPRHRKGEWPKEGQVDRSLPSGDGRLRGLLWREVWLPLRSQWSWWESNRGRRWRAGGSEALGGMLEPGDSAGSHYFHSYSFREMKQDVREAGWRKWHFWSLRELVHRRPLFRMLSWTNNPLYLVLHK